MTALLRCQTTKGEGAALSPLKGNVSRETSPFSSLYCLVSSFVKGFGNGLYDCFHSSLWN